MSAIHVRGDPREFTPRLSAIATDVDVTLRLTDVMPLKDVVNGEVRLQAFWVRLTTIVSAMILVLSLVSIYAVMSFAVSRRTPRRPGTPATLSASSCLVAPFTIAGALVGLPAGRYTCESSVPREEMMSSARRQRLVMTFVGIALLAVFTWTQRVPVNSSAGSPDAIAEAFQNRTSNVQVAGAGVVRRVLPDDKEGSRHQRFILELSNGQTVLVSHNIDLAARLSSLDRGDTVEFFGEYEWNADGGVIHWTHHDPVRRHVDGWLRHEGRTVK